MGLIIFKAAGKAHTAMRKTLHGQHASWALNQTISLSVIPRLDALSPGDCKMSSSMYYRAN